MKNLKYITFLTPCDKLQESITRILNGNLLCLIYEKQNIKRRRKFKSYFLKKSLLQLFLIILNLYRILYLLLYIFITQLFHLCDPRLNPRCILRKNLLQNQLIAGHLVASNLVASRLVVSHLVVDRKTIYSVRKTIDSVSSLIAVVSQSLCILYFPIEA
jgi:hypothetical protein